MCVLFAQSTFDLCIEASKLTFIAIQVEQVNNVGSEAIHLVLLNSEYLAGSNPDGNLINLGDVPLHPIAETLWTYHVREMLPIEPSDKAIIRIVKDTCSESKIIDQYVCLRLRQVLDDKQENRCH